MSRRGNPASSPTCVTPVRSFVVCPFGGTVMHRCTWVMCDRTLRHPSEHYCRCGHHWPAVQER